MLSADPLPVRDRVGALTGELRQYLGWLLTTTGHHEQASTELDAALAIGIELDDPERAVDQARHALA